ncbi:hypothetical protein MKQ70_20235 [Chitinophaga sedimenti]|uniref:hypothetical protein n=1 Tax=Chitinophaga sedimenti TaxID=2033606 RepID=UPI0020031BCF|nr:hypothetical protein [Chitinophaga sedimenti]MCK7557207.1 hypothetical protein [Chitinophaga sedimenti]
MKKAILLPLIALLCCVSMATKAASIALYGGTPPSWATVTIDGSNNITVTDPSGGSTIYRIDFYFYGSPSYYAVPGPGTSNHTFNSNGAYLISIGWNLYGWPYTASAHYQITY